MSYTVSTFSNLIQQYSSSQELRNFLQSEEGGQLRVIEPDQGKQFAIIRYVKGVSDFTKPWTSLFRSVVWNTVTNRPVCFAPQKALKSEPPSDTTLRVEEFLEGVMVNAFLDEQDKLHWTTRSMLGAGSGFYGEKTFAEMISEAEKEHGFQENNLANILKESGFTFASFVLQHPAHRVVQVIQKPKLALIHLGKVDDVGNIDISYTPDTWSEPFAKLAVPVYPPLGEGETASQRLERMMPTADAQGYGHWQGLVFRGSNGERWRIRSVGYTILREIRGKESSIEERFVRLRGQNMVRLYLQHWPEDSQKFMELEMCVRDLTTNIYKEYCAHHKEKSKVFMDIPVALRTPVYELHGMYLNKLRPANQTLKMPAVIQYVNNLNTDTLSNLLRRTAVVV